MLVSLGVSLYAALLAVSGVVAAPTLSPDAIEHVGIGQALCHGRGFVDPVQWSYFLDADPPLPALAVRAPGVPLLAASALCLGATLHGLLVVHALWASLLLGAVVWCTRSWLTLPGAALAGVLFASLPSWQLVATRPLTEASGLGLFFLTLALLRVGVASIPGALAASALTLVSWLTHPTLGLLAPVIVGAVVLERGIVAALRARPVWVYAIGVVAGLLILQTFARSLTGFAPYAGYGVHAHIFDTLEASHYQRVYTGVFEFLVEHRDAVLAQVRLRSLQISLALFSPAQLWLGWLAVPGAIYGLLPLRRIPLEVRACALAAVGFFTIWSLNYASFDLFRFPLLPAVAGTLCGIHGLGRGTDALWRRFGSDGESAGGGCRAGASGILLATLAGVVSLAGLSGFVWPDAEARAAFRAAPLPVAECAALEPDALVAAAVPWRVFRECGNSALLLPPDLDTDAIRNRFLDEKRPGYVLATPAGNHAWLAESNRLTGVARFGGAVLYRVTGDRYTPRSWDAAPPIQCAGREAGCTRTRASR
jgi:hypothetical protein